MYVNFYDFSIPVEEHEIDSHYIILLNDILMLI